MRKLAAEFKVNFQEGNLSFWNLLFGLYYIFRWEERDANHLEGSIGDHKVHIYDKFSFPLGSELGARMTVIEIDGEAKKTKFTVADEVIISPLLTPIRRIKEILRKLRTELGQR